MRHRVRAKKRRGSQEDVSRLNYEAVLEARRRESRRDVVAQKCGRRGKL